MTEPVRPIICSGDKGVSATAYAGRGIIAGCGLINLPESRPPRPAENLKLSIYTLPDQYISGVITFCGAGPSNAARIVSADLVRMSSHAWGVKNAECGVMTRRPSHHGSRAR